MAVKFNLNLFPPDGWVYTDAQGVKHKGTSFATLVGKVVNYRVLNKFAVGDPAREVHEQLCKNFPGYCRNGYNKKLKRVIPQSSKGCSSCKKSRQR